MTVVQGCPNDFPACQEGRYPIRFAQRGHDATPAATLVRVLVGGWWIGGILVVAVPYFDEDRIADHPYLYPQNRQPLKVGIGGVRVECPGGFHGVGDKLGNDEFGVVHQVRE